MEVIVRSKCGSKEICIRFSCVRQNSRYYWHKNWDKQLRRSSLSVRGIERAVRGQGHQAVSDQRGLWRSAWRRRATYPPPAIWGVAHPTLWRVRQAASPAGTAEPILPRQGDPIPNRRGWALADGPYRATPQRVTGWITEPRNEPDRRVSEADTQE